MTRRFVLSPTLLSFLLFIATVSSLAQEPATGLPPLGSFAGGPFDVVNLANLDVHFAIPVFSRPGRGIPFSYSLGYDSLVWVPEAPNGAKVWTPVASSSGSGPVYNFGWRAVTEAATGYVSFATFTMTQSCQTGPYSYGETTSTWDGLVYHDPSGGLHPLPPGSNSINEVSITTSSCGTVGTTIYPVKNAVPQDNSGYIVSTNSSSALGPATVNAQGKLTIVTPPVGYSTGTGSVTDANGNTISVSVSNGVTTFTDTLGTALTVTGTPSTTSYVEYTYSAPGAQGTGTPVFARVNYTTYTVQTCFGVSGITEFSPTTEYLIWQILLPDGTAYSFGYEPTVGTSSCTPQSGAVTGRIASVTLPTGGTINYSYAATEGIGCGNDSNCMMADGSPAAMSKTSSGVDAPSQNIDWTYTRQLNPNGGGNAQFTQTNGWDGYGNLSNIWFNGIYETQRNVYEGTSTLLDSTWTCYNGINANCSTSTQIAAPIWAKDFNDCKNESACNNHFWIDTRYNTYGLLTQENDYDWGNTGPLLTTTNIQYDATLCNSHNICDHPDYVQILDATPKQVSYTAYTYDGGADTKGNVTAVSKWVNSSSNLVWQYSYNGNETLNTATDPNATVTSYGYSGTCNSAFPTSVTTGWLTTQYGYNCTGGVVTSVTDPNGATASTSYTDPYYWRPAKTTDAYGYITYYNYKGVTNYSSSPAPQFYEGSVESVELQNFSNAVVDKLSTPDALGRPTLQQTREGLNSGTWDTTEYVYDISGNVSWVSLPFQDSGGVIASDEPATNYTYDGLGRYVDIQGSPWTNFDMHYTYNLNDVRVTLNPAPPGENAKSRQYEYYVWGNIKSVCEITGASNGYSCGQNTAANGFLTSYWYNPLGQLLSVSQSGQSRTFTYDGLGRMTQQIDPESGTTTFSYDSVNDGHCSGSYSGDKIERVDAASNISCYTWDGLHRLTGVNYVSGPNAANTPNKGYIYDQSSLGTGYPVPTYPAGRLVLAYTSYQGTWTSWEAFGYNARGDTTDAYFRYYPATGSSIYHVQQSYYPDEATMSQQGFIGNGTTTPFSHAFGFALEGEGRPYGVWDSTENGETVYGPTTYNPFGEPTQVSIVGGQENFQYDPNSARMTQWSSVTANTQTGNLTWNANASLQSLAITDNGNSGNNQTCSYIYDDEERISSAQCGTNGSIWSQTFQYDFFGNIWKNGTSSWTPASYTNNRASSITYDGMGNAISDGANRYSYDAEGRPLTVGSAQITYDALGRAVVENKNGTATNIVYSPTGQKFAFMNGSTVEQYFVAMPAGMQAVFNGNGLQYFRHSDWLGSSRFASNAADGSIYYDSAYAPFGENYAEMGTSDRSFTGQTQDTVSGLYDFLFRQQSSAQGRWLVPDPAGMAAVDITNPQTWNRYAYLANNPLGNVDPLGLIDCDLDPGAIGCDGYGDGSGGGGGGGGDPWVGGIYDPFQTLPFFNGEFTGTWNADTLNSWQSQQFWQNPSNISAWASLPQNQNPAGQRAYALSQYSGAVAQASSLDPCVYLNNAGNGVESVDQNSSQSECNSTGGQWVPPQPTGTTYGVSNGYVYLVLPPSPKDVVCQRWGAANFFAGTWGLGFSWAAGGPPGAFLVGSVTGLSGTAQGLYCGF